MGCRTFLELAICIYTNCFLCELLKSPLCETSPSSWILLLFLICILIFLIAPIFPLGLNSSCRALTPE